MSEFALPAAPEAVPAARRHALACLNGHDPDLAYVAELVVSELVTNAVLHGAPPIRLRLAAKPRVRVEVSDGGRLYPIPGAGTPEATTGRGLALVGRLVAAWGVEPIAGGGKTVWAELPGDGEIAALAAPELAAPELPAPEQPEPAEPGSEPAGPRYDIRLGPVLTDLLVAAKTHIDGVVRELTLLAADDTPPEGPMARLVDTVTREWAEPRAEIKRQAIAAAASGKRFTDLTLRLPATAAEPAERYLAALDEVDEYARAARLLAMAPPRSHQIFRRWYVRSIVAQLRALAAGQAAPPVTPFPQALAAEVDRLSLLEHAWTRLQLLQRVTAELTGATTVEQITETIVTNATRHLGARSVRLYLTDGAVLRATDPAASDPFVELPVDADLPGPEVLRSGRPLFLRSREAIMQRYPALSGAVRRDSVVHVAPLRAGEQVLGVLSLTYPGGSDVADATQADFVVALANAAAQALERIRAIDRAVDANRRLSFLADASVALSATLDVDAALRVVTELFVPRLADWCVVHLVRDEELQVAAVGHPDPERIAWARTLDARFPSRMEAAAGVPAVIRSGRSELHPHISDRLLGRVAADPEHLAVLRKLGLRSAAVVPLPGRGGVLGAITLVYAESGRRYQADDLPLIEDVARRCALALETATWFREQSGRLADVIRVAEAAQRAILAPPPPRIGPVRLAARYVSAAAEARIGGDIYEVAARPGGLRLLIGDVRGKGLAAVRTATVVLGEFRAAADDYDDLAAVARQVDRRLRRHLAEEDFVTAVIAEITDEGNLALVSCGHPAPLKLSGGAVTEIEVTHAPPLGLGASPMVTTGRLAPGDRLLLFTDGLIEARAQDGRFVDVEQLASAALGDNVGAALDGVLGRLRQAVGDELGDDLALLLAEFAPET